jgi:fructose-1,6-bisphosphatase-3
MDRLKESFLSSKRLWEQFTFVVKNGTMWLRRDQAVIFHACVPVDADGNDLPLAVDRVEFKGRALFDALELVIRRAFRRGGMAAEEDKDWLWYLWTGPSSPLFGKDKMATFETYFVEDKQAQVETKNPYFKLIHDADFCNRIAAEFGVEHDGLIVNGHVPVRVDKGEEPVKRGGNAVTIDGAFSEAYGDRGYTLVLAPDRVNLAEHHHFESITEAITAGADIVPKVTAVRSYSKPRLIADTEDGTLIRENISQLERLIGAYEEGILTERGQ